MARPITAAAALLALTVSPALAQSTPVGAQPTTGDTPGGGGTRLPRPVTGEQVYRQVCQACHMADGKGGTGAGTIPALAMNPRLNVAAYPITMVVHGKGAMPSFTGMLDERQVAEVVGYVRTHFGNSYAKPVAETEVKKLWVAPVASGH